MQARSRLYGRRIKGDLDLGLEPARIDGAGNKAWARMDFPGRRLPGRADQDIYHKSDTQKFEIGTKRVEYGRTFRYAIAGEDITAAGPFNRLLAAGNFNPFHTTILQRDAFWGKPLNEVGLDAPYVDLSEALAAEDRRPENFFQGGYLINTSEPGAVAFRYNQAIVWSDESEATFTRVYLDHPPVVVMPVLNDIGAVRSPYSRVIEGMGEAGLAQSWVSFIGMMHCGPLDEGDFFWLQTQGPVWITPFDIGGDTCPGRVANKRDAYAWIDGTIRVDPADGTLQRVGYLITATMVGFGGADIMLQLE